MTLTRNQWAGLAAAAAAVLTLVFWPRGPQTPEAQVRALVARAVREAEDKQVGDVVEHLAENFRGKNGETRQDIKSLLAYQLLRGGVVGVLNPTLDVTVIDDTHARFWGRFVFARDKIVSVDALDPRSQLGAYRIEAEVEKRDGAWVLTTASYERL